MFSKLFYVKMNVFIVSLLCFVRIIHAIENEDSRTEQSSLENVQGKLFPTKLLRETDTPAIQNAGSLSIKNIEDNTTSNSETTNTEKYLDHSDFVVDLSKAIASKLASLLRKKLEQLLSTKYSVSDRNENKISKSLVVNDKQNVPKFEDTLELTGSSQTVVNAEKKTETRQFLYNPYFPFGKDAHPDEKISFHDVLPVKMVKFIKSMVEDAPWEAMFMKMVRMVVDQFVDKIIEQMFAHKEELDDKWRSMVDHQSPSWSLLKKSLTSVVRLRRSIAEKKSEKEASWDSSSFSQSNRISKNDEHKTKETSESWLDSVLDYLFPEDEQAEAEYDLYEDRKKRDIDISQYTPQQKRLRMEDILHTFLLKYRHFSEDKTYPEKVSTIKASISSQNVSESVNSLESSVTQSTTEASPEVTTNVMLTPLPERWSKLLQPEVLKRSKRSMVSKEIKRLWQESQRSRPADLNSRDECSLRKACNAGRLLSRLPSVQDLTIQLKEYGKEPHWDALLWGMTKKKCSKIFCKRQRSPKGAKYSWKEPPADRFLKKNSASRGHSRSHHKSNVHLRE